MKWFFVMKQLMALEVVKGDEKIIDLESNVDTFFRVSNIHNA